MKHLRPLQYRSLMLVVLSFISIAVSKGEVLADFESAETSPALSGGVISIVDNPAKAGINTSNKVGRFEKTSGNWHYFAIDYPNAKAIGKSNTLRFKINASQKGRVFAKFWNGSVVVVERWAPDWGTQPEPNVWTQCVMDMSGVKDIAFTKLEIAACVDNDAEAVVYFDDVEIYNPLALSGIPELRLVSPKAFYKDSVLAFDASKSFDWNDLPLHYTWDFGDGTTAADTAIVAHTYASTGLFQASLRIQNTDGKVATRMMNIFVISPNAYFTALTFLNKKPKVYDQIDAVLQLNKLYANPYDPDIIALDATITKPDSSVYSMPCFYNIQTTNAGSSWLVDSSSQYWNLRFTADTPGIYKVKIKAKDAAGVQETEEYTINVEASGKRGFVASDVHQKQYYRYANGDAYLPVGENVAWSNKDNKINDYYNQLKALSDNGANLVRYWTVTFSSTALEGRKGYSYYKGLGIYSQEAAAMLDSVFGLCKKFDIQLMLTIFQHGILSENVNSNWDINPLNTANGGFLAKPADFFESAEAKQHVQHLLRYYVARWGYSSNLFAWEFFNEVDLTGNTNSNPASWVTNVNNWHTEMGAFLHEADPYKHMQTTSLSGWMDHPLAKGLSVNTGIDVMQFHSYGDDIAATMQERFTNLKGKTQKPIICGEFGKLGTAENRDEFRSALWVAYINQLPAFHWDWDRAYTSSFYTDMKAIASFFNAGFAPTDTFVSKTFVTTGLKSLSTAALLYTNNIQLYCYDKSFATDITNTSITLSNVRYGYYVRTFFSPTSQTQYKADTILIINNLYSLRLPAFSKDIACKLTFAGAYVHPIAIVGEDKTVAPGTNVSLTGEQSSNPKKLPIAFTWKIVRKPAGSAAVLNTDNAMTTNFIADKVGNYVIELKVSDADETSLADTVVVHVSAPPVANAGADMQTTKGKLVVLDGSSSYDAENETIKYKWSIISQPAGSTPELYFVTKPVAKFKADSLGNYLVALVVNDGLSDSKADTIQVQVLEAVSIKPSNGQEIGIETYPNPVTEQVRINVLSPLNENASIEIFDVSGQRVFVTHKLLYANQILSVKVNMMSFANASGLYVLKVSTNTFAAQSKIAFLK